MVQFQKAKTSSDDDSRNILRLIDPMATNYDESRAVDALNAEVVKRLQRWLVEAAADVVEMPLDAKQDVPLRQGIEAAQLMMSISDWSRATRCLERYCMWLKISRKLARIRA